MKQRKLNKERKEKWKNNEMKWTDNDIGAEGAMIISEALKINTTLTELYLMSDDNE